MMKNRLYPLAVIALALAGCEHIKMAQPEVFDHGDEAFYERPVGVQSADSARSEDVRRDKFHIKFKKIADKRRPEAFGNSVEQDVIYEYDPDKLQGGTRALFQSYLDEYFGVNSRSNEELIAELDIRNLRTQILRGDFFTGRNGKYSVELEADVRVRNGLGTVLLNQTYTLTETAARRTANGYPPSEHLDRKRMVKAVGAAMRELGDKISYDVRVKMQNAKLVR